MKFATILIEVVVAPTSLTSLQDSRNNNSHLSTLRGTVGRSLTTMVLVDDVLKRGR